MIDIKEFIPFDKENAISVKDLSDKIGASNRKTRKLIEKAREEPNDFVIISSCSFKGYYKSKDPVEIENYIREMSNRAKKIFFNIKQAKIFLEEIGQDKLF